MIDKLIEKIGEKAFGALCAVLGAIAAALIQEIRLYFEKQKAFQKGYEKGRQLLDEQQQKWEQKVKDIQEDCNKTIREKIKEMKELKKAFHEYVKSQKA